MSPGVTWRSVCVGILVIGALAVAGVAATSAPTTRTVAPPVPLAGAATSYADTTWVWTGRALCQRGAEALGTGLLRREGTGASVALSVPLVVVQALAAGPDGLLASGRDARCRPTALVSRDHGRTWLDRAELAGSVSLDASGSRTVWHVPGGDGATVRRTTGLTELPVRQPCPRGTAASLVSSRGSEAWLLCQDPLGLQRTLAHTSDGGANWDVPGNELSGSGLDGVGLARTLDLRQAPSGWLLKPARRCPEGELRVTRNGGSDWESLPCPRATIPVSQVLTVAFTDAQRGVLAGMRGVRVVLAETADGGRSWTLTQ